MGDLSELQEKTLEEFKRYIKENNVIDHPQYDDYYFLRFLRARKFDLDKAKLMFHNFLDWRKENDVDHILTVCRGSFYLFEIAERVSDCKLTIYSLSEFKSKVYS